MEKTPNNKKHEDRSFEAPEKQREFTIEQYLNKLGLTFGELQGKYILDIGAGSGEFVKAASDVGVNAIAFDLPPEGFEEKEQRLKDIQYVEGNAVSLPFNDSSFDLVVSHAALPHFVVPPERSDETESIYSRHNARVGAVLETIRVLKLGGEIRFAPVIRNEKPDIFGRSESVERIIEMLKKNPAIEIVEELIERNIEYYDEEGNVQKFSDSYRLIIRKII